MPYPLGHSPLLDNIAFNNTITTINIFNTLKLTPFHRCIDSIRFTLTNPPKVYPKNVWRVLETSSDKKTVLQFVSPFPIMLDSLATPAPIVHSTIISSHQSKTIRRIALVELNHNNLGQLRCLNQVLFPVRYSDKFYADVLGSPELSRLGKHFQLSSPHLP